MAVARLAITVSKAVLGDGVIDGADVGSVCCEETDDRMEVMGKVSLAPIKV